MYIFAVHGQHYDVVNLNGKVYIVTGSNSGIGLETARSLCQMEATVILACRSKDRALVAQADIISTVGCLSDKVY